jgi:hypothetical protein
MFCHLVSRRNVKSFASERRRDFRAREAGLEQRFFTSIENRAANSAARPIRMCKKRANARGVFARIDERIGFSAIGARTAFRLPLAPSAARNDLPSRNFSDEICLIFDQLPIDAKDRPNRSFTLRFIVMRRLQCAHREWNQFVESGNIVGARDANVPWHHRASHLAAHDFRRGRREDLIKGNLRPSLHAIAPLAQLIQRRPFGRHQIRFVHGEFRAVGFQNEHKP